MIKISGLTKSFGKDTGKILKDINLNIEEGDFFCILGRSGCGKTTLLNIMAGFDLKYEGQVLYKGKEIRKADSSRILMFQEAALFPWLNVLQNVEFGMKMNKIDKKRCNEVTNYYLNLVGLQGQSTKFIHELSGGMKQRVALARSLTLESEVLLMDEPFSALDFQTKERLREEILSICEKEKKTVVFVTHDIDEAIYLGNKIAVMGHNPGNVKRIFNLRNPRRARDDNYKSEIKERIKELMRR